MRREQGLASRAAQLCLPAWNPAQLRRRAPLRPLPGERRGSTGLNAATSCGSPQESIPVGAVPRGFSLSPDGSRLYVTNSWDDTLSVIDTARLEVVATWSDRRREPSSVRRRARRPAVIRGQPDQQRYRCARCPDRRRTEATAGWPRSKLPGLLAGRIENLLRHPRLSQPAHISHRAGVWRSPISTFPALSLSSTAFPSHGIAACRFTLSSLRGRPPWRSRRVPPQEPHSPRPSRTRWCLRRHTHRLRCRHRQAF